MLKKFTLISFILAIILGVSCIVMGIVGFKDVYSMATVKYKHLSTMQLMHESILAENSTLTVKGNAVKNLSFTISPDNRLNIITDNLGYIPRITKVTEDKHQFNTNINLSREQYRNAFSLDQDLITVMMQAIFGYSVSSMEIQVPASTTLVISERDYKKSSLTYNSYNGYSIYIDSDIQVQVTTDTPIV